jgi:hypothetical protein
MDRIEAATGSTAGALTLLRTVENMLASGLLDEGDRRQGEAVAERLGDVVLANLVRGERSGVRHHPVEVERALEATLERLLIGRRRFAELRTRRNARRLFATQPQARVRRIAALRQRARPAA